jgi:hypothetical protein
MEALWRAFGELPRKSRVFTFIANPTVQNGKAMVGDPLFKNIGIEHVFFGFYLSVWVGL